ncbi:hypothetical protein VMT65_11735 [Nocardia sp. CDC153]|uniref:hypothetical protein n=1 Tax=Nocardia sp. CDC153 TaxID=3112167 RepID=UPI002DBF3946|nr:hypothetical protein [Nocardia sp. CDC153]MEC3953706.1 hypothetical protein [Nocardia sp. CDC153]
MATNGPFGIDPEDFERALREAGVDIRDLLGKASDYLDRTTTNPLTSLLGLLVQPERAPKREGPTTGESGDGVWAVYVLDDSGTATVDQIFPTELEALRAHRDNTDPHRRVRFLPYGVPVSALDEFTKPEPPQD